MVSSGKKRPWNVADVRESLRQEMIAGHRVSPARASEIIERFPDSLIQQWVLEHPDRMLAFIQQVALIISFAGR